MAFFDSTLIGSFGVGITDLFFISLDCMKSAVNSMLLLKIIQLYYFSKVAENREIQNQLDSVDNPQCIIFATCEKLLLDKS